MLRPISLACLFLVAACPAAVSLGQFPTPGPEHDVIKLDVGDWDAEVKAWMGPTGQADPDASPQVSKGVEKNRMIGAFWMISTFKGEFGGMDFEGHAINGYDQKTKKYTGTWIDSLSPSAMKMTGTYDAKTKTLTFDTQGVGMDGQEYVGKSVTQHVSKDKRMVTMYEVRDGKEIKAMEITYTRQ